MEELRLLPGKLVANQREALRGAKPTPCNGGEALGFNELSAWIERCNWLNSVLGTFTVDSVFHSCD